MTTTKATIPGSELAVMKQDGKGRVRITEVRREQLLDEFERSGLSGPQFATLTGIKYQTFATWVQKRKRKGVVTSVAANVSVPAAESVKWLEAVVESAQGSGTDASLVLQLPGGVRLEVADEKQAALAATILAMLKHKKRPLSRPLVCVSFI